jgi:hypothetical protein
MSRRRLEMLYVSLLKHESLQSEAEKRARANHNAHLLTQIKKEFSVWAIQLEKCDRRRLLH